MYYRQSNKLQSKQWLKKNAWRLNRLGIPSEILSDHDRFLFVVQEGWDLESGWRATWIDDNDIDELLLILKERFDSSGWDLVSVLKRRAER